MTLLRDKEAHRLMKGRDGTFVASCTHLFWNPRYPEVKAAQAHLLCVALRSYLQRHNVPGLLGSPAVVLAGDFNSLPSKTQSDEYDHVPEGESLVSGAYTCLVRGKMPRSHCDHPAHRRPREAAALRGLQLHDAGLGFVSAAVEAWGAEPPFTNRTTTFSGCLDYVFYTPEHFGAVAALELPFAWVREKGAGDRGCSKHRNMVSAEEFTPIPDESWPSDHLAMGFDLRWRSE
jgi:CCR4-NOT transcription complex subunit 6